MGSDVSRVRFDPLRDFAGVVLQQGRLLLDADFNEYVALLDRHLRAETCDLTSFGPDPGHAGVAWVPRQTPDAFRLTVAAGAITIGRGRMYVDGLLAENHGLPPLAFDPLLSEQTGSTDTPWNDQPYGPTPEENLPDGNGPHLAYLDVWQREVTHLEDPELVEVAVGVDTTARHQTAWQVRLLPNVGAITCETDDEDIPGWLDVIRPSGGRLRTDTVDDGAEEPCELPPVAGYSGLENQTYRVEIHEGGAPGTATFKWSRDNGSVAIPVLDKVSTTSLRLASVGKDDVLRVSTGDWLEILDDTYELRRKPGEVRKVTVDDAARTITFTGALPADLLPANAADAAARHVRVRRWDQAGVVKSGAGATLVDLDAAGSTGLITVPATATTQVVLEHRVAASFSVEGGGEFKDGDHWIFAARTADASVEVLDEAPPHGVHHHYARLGVVTFPGTFAPDCRRLWPPTGTGDESCDCTVCVTPASHSSGTLTVQAAIDQVKAAGGGTVCLAAGVYDVTVGLTVEQARSLRIRGQGPATVLVARGTALTIRSSAGIAVEKLAIVSGAGAPAAVRVRSVAFASLVDLVVLSYGREDTGSGIELSGAAALVTLRGNVVVARTAIDAGAGDRIGLFAAGLRVEENVAFGLDRGIDLGGAAAYLYACRVSGNDVLAGRSGGIVATGAVAPRGSLDVLGNKVATDGPGIVVGTDATVDGNTVNRLGRDGGSDGIVIAPGPFPVPPSDVRVTGNRLYDRTDNGIVLLTSARNLVVKHNVLTGPMGNGIVVSDKAAAERAVVENNQVRLEGEGFGTGIAIGRVTSAAVVANTISRGAGPGVLGAGIWVLGSENVRISGNLVDGIAPEQITAFAAGIAVFGPFERAWVTDNIVRFGAEGALPGGRGWTALEMQTFEREPARPGNKLFAVPIRGEALIIGPAWAFAVRVREGHAEVCTNAFTGGGASVTCLVRVGGDVVAEGNQCAHTLDTEPVGMYLRGSSITASTNRVRGTRAMLVLDVAEDRFAALGNLAAGGTHLGSPGAGLPSPWDPFNPIVS
jgi:hypothetical protein